MVGAELLGTLIEAKRLGFDFGQILSLIILYVLLRRDLSKVIDQQFNKLIDALKSLEKAHNDRLNKIEAHVGLKNTKEE